MRRLAAVFLMFVLAPPAGHAQMREPDENVTYGYAQVLRAAPVYEMVRTRVPEQRCGQNASDGGNPTGGTVVGAVVGGALGNQAGKGDGRKASTIAGAVLGGAIGRRIDKNNGSANRCTTVNVERDERRLVGYDVEYQFKGEKYMSRLDADPGNRLRVRVSVTPDMRSLGAR